MAGRGVAASWMLTVIVAVVLVLTGCQKKEAAAEPAPARSKVTKDKTPDPVVDEEPVVEDDEAALEDDEPAAGDDEPAVGDDEDPASGAAAAGDPDDGARPEPEGPDDGAAPADDEPADGDEAPEDEE